MIPPNNSIKGWLSPLCVLTWSPARCSTLSLSRTPVNLLLGYLLPNQQACDAIRYSTPRIKSAIDHPRISSLDRGALSFAFIPIRPPSPAALALNPLETKPKDAMISRSWLREFCRTRSKNLGPNNQARLPLILVPAARRSPPLFLFITPVLLVPAGSVKSHQIPKGVQGTRMGLRPRLLNVDKSVYLKRGAGYFQDCQLDR